MSDHENDNAVFSRELLEASTKSAQEIDVLVATGQFVRLPNGAAIAKSALIAMPKDEFRRLEGFGIIPGEPMTLRQKIFSAFVYDVDSDKAVLTEATSDE